MSQWTAKEPAGNQLGKQDLVCTDYLLLKYKVTFLKSDSNPQQNDDSLTQNHRAAGFCCIWATHTHTSTPVCREEGAAMQRRGHIQHFMVTALELSHQICFAQWFWQRLSRSCPARTGMTPDCDHAMATVVHQWLPRTPTTVRFTQTTGKLWSDWLKQPSHGGNVLSHCCSLKVFSPKLWKIIALMRLYGAQ